MKSLLNPYINFNGTAREAMDFYKNIFGGTLDITTYKEGKMPEDPADPNSGDKIMHAMLVAENGMTIMASDVPPGMDYNPGTNVSISLSGDNVAELTGYWDALSAGATIVMPFEKAPWGDTFGALIDRFGISWMVDIGPSA